MSSAFQLFRIGSKIILVQFCNPAVQRRKDSNLERKDTNFDRKDITLGRRDFKPQKEGFKPSNLQTVTGRIKPMGKG